MLLLLLLGLNAFNLRALNPRTTAQIFLLTSLSVVVFLLFVTVLVLLLRNLFKLLAEQRSQVLGARLRTRMFIGALLVSFVPALFMFLFSFLLMNRSIERWFSQPALEVREDSARIAMELSHYASLNARAEAESMAHSQALVAAMHSGDRAAMVEQMRAHQVSLQGGFAVLYRDATPVATYELPQAYGPAQVRSWLNRDDGQQIGPGQPITAAILQSALRPDEAMLDIGRAEYALGAASVGGNGVVVAALPMPVGMPGIVAELSSGATEYWALYRQRRIIRATYFLLLLMLTALVFFASSWLALYVSRRITSPLEALADAMDAIGNGEYRHRVTAEASGEMGELVRSFNHMAADLEESRHSAETSSRELSAANQALETRRRELEAILETIPSGVVTLDANRRVLIANRSFTELFGLYNLPQIMGASLESLLPEEFSGELVRLERRAHRMGVASTELELRGSAGTQHVAITIAALGPQGSKERGSILVMEDVTEFLRAQRQAAWKEVAQRIAHEIRNPLTPIALSAERILRYVDRGLPEREVSEGSFGGHSAAIRKCCEAILGSVDSLRTLVGQFSTLAEFPVAHPRSACLNQIVESALVLFEGRILNIRVEKHLDRSLPPVMADPEALRRAIANLIDNAAEAMRESLLRVLSIRTCPGERAGMAEIIIADTGPGITAEMRERLFLPWFSTRQRGTGLGLSIVAKIVQDHGGSIRAENNLPAGARFIIELPLAEGGSAENTLTTNASRA